MADRNHDERLEEGALVLPFESGPTSRRSFLRLAGFGIAAASIGGCTGKDEVRMATWAEAPEGIVAGERYSLATTCGGCPAGCGVQAICRDGRPVKLEGLAAHPVSLGGLCATGQATVLSLYDSHRFDGPRAGGREIAWAEADRLVGEALEATRAAGGKVRLLTATIHSPSTLAWSERFLQAAGDGRHVMFDPLSASGILDAHRATHGARVLPRYRFERAAVIASFDADFLGTWISPVEYAAGYAAGRRPDEDRPRMSRHWQFEPRMSVTGGCADERLRLAPWETADALAGLCDLLGTRAGATTPAAGKAASMPRRKDLERLADELWEARGRSLVVCGGNDTATQTLVNLANHLLGNYGRTLDIEQPSFQRRGSDADVQALRRELEAGEVGFLLVHGLDPAHDLPEFGDLLESARFLVTTAPLPDGTTPVANLLCPVPHELEAWDDAEPVAGVASLVQPASPVLRSARTLRESLAAWCGQGRPDRELLRDHWKRQLHQRTRTAQAFAPWFHDALRTGFVTLPAIGGPAPAWDPAGVRVPAPVAPPAAGTLAAVLHPTVQLLDGRHAQNPWLQELPDPVTRIAWDNCAVLSPAAAGRLQVESGDVVSLRSASGSDPLELPVWIQPGQHDGIVSVALGYGRPGTGRFADIGPEWWEGEPTVTPGGVVGVDASPLLSFRDGTLRYSDVSVAVKPTGRRAELASVQEHHSLEVPPSLAPADGKVRDAVRAATLAEWRDHPETAFHETHHPKGDLWPEDHAPTGPHWGMVIDLTACTGCSACVVACQAENNIPVVGKDEVHRHREMSWIRIDRYHSGEGDDVQVSRQPMLCQHCGNAPCESVCPVLATVHGNEGLNQQVYNRCVGTRYCANTCPYKVRRFNWFEYARDDTLQNHALNPDVTVRSRGVMEKCSMCMQRIQDSRNRARAEGRALRDGEIRTACDQSCPTRAITFGDLKDPESAVATKARSPRSYRVLEELNVDPGVRYLGLVRNTSGGKRS